MHRLNNLMVASNSNRNLPIITITKGIEEEPIDQRVSIAPNTTHAILQKRVGGNNWVPVGGVPTITQANVTAFVNLIQNNQFAGGRGSHRLVLTQSAAWRAFYHVASRTLMYLDTVTGLPLGVPPQQDTLPCFDCGLVLPLNNMDIDHQRPQGRQANPLEPICKVFRAMGLTIAGPAGPKGNNVFTAWQTQVNGLAPAIPTTLETKFTLNDVGKIYYTLADSAGLLGDDMLQGVCLNHYINLRPLCGVCNTSNRNKPKFRNDDPR
jgi:hypothetical protein